MPRLSASSLPELVRRNTFFSLDLTVVLQVALVADEELDDVLVTELVDFSQPVFNVLEGLAVGDVVNQDDSVGTLVVGGGNGFESLLSSGVPDLEFDGAAVQVEGANLEVDSDGGEEAE